MPGLKIASDAHTALLLSRVVGIATRAAMHTSLPCSVCGLPWSTHCADRHTCSGGKAARLAHLASLAAPTPRVPTNSAGQALRRACERKAPGRAPSFAWGNSAIATRAPRHARYALHTPAMRLVLACGARLTLFFFGVGRIREKGELASGTARRPVAAETAKDCAELAQWARDARHLPAALLKRVHGA